MKNRLNLGLCLTMLSFSMTLSANDAVRAFEIESINGETIRMVDYKDQWVVVNFWATWCKPCRKELPDLQEFHEAPNNAVVIGLAFEDQPIEAIIDFLNEYHVKYPVAVVDVFEPPEVFGYPEVMPTSVLISPDGEIAKTWYGEKNKEGVITVELISAFIEKATGAE